MPRVVIVEDDRDTRDVLSVHVKGHPQLEVIAEVGTVAEALAVLGRRPDVVLVDLGLPDGSGIDVIRAAAALEPRPEIMVITVFGDERHVVSAIEAGATGYLLKDAEGDAVVAAVQELLAGGSPITPAIARHILNRFRPLMPPHTDGIKLTAREVEVLRLVSRGYTNTEIAALLTMSFHTVTSHIKHIYRKLAVGSRSEAVFEAAQQGIIDIHPARE